MHELSYQWNGKLGGQAPRPRALARAGDPADAGDLLRPRRRVRPPVHWYLNHIYRREAEYGYAGLEDLWSPGATHVRVTPGQTVHFACSADPLELSTVVEQADRQLRDADARFVGTRTLVGAPLFDDVAPAAKDVDLSALVNATEDHLLSSPAGESYGVAAQFHWSPPSVRAAVVGFAGLYLVPGRLDQARSLLTVLAGQLRNGLLPTDFPTDGSEPVVRGADVSLWFVNAVRQYLLYRGDEAAVARHLLPACMSCHRGVPPGDRPRDRGRPRRAAAVRVGRRGRNVDGQRRRRQPVTPRFGRPVEVNALWYNALLSAAGDVPAARPPGRRRRCWSRPPPAPGRVQPAVLERRAAVLLRRGRGRQPGHARRRPTRPSARTNCSPSACRSRSCRPSGGRPSSTRCGVSS
jgi:glycogen debranching enzyme